MEKKFKAFLIVALVAIVCLQVVVLRNVRGLYSSLDYVAKTTLQRIDTLTSKVNMIRFELNESEMSNN